MEMSWQDYENVTKFIYETLGKEIGVKIECFGNSCKVTGKSGVKHQIDVLTNFSDGIHSYKTAIECKYWNSNIDKDIIMKVASIVEDASIHKGVIVCKKGFTQDAISFAKYKNIGLVELRECNEQDWEGRVKNIQINLNMLLPEIKSLEFYIGKDTITDLKPGEIAIDQLKLKSKTNEIISFDIYVDDFRDNLLKQPDGFSFEKSYKFDDEWHVINLLTGSETPIWGIKLMGILNIMKENVEIKGEDHTWLIMKAIFEEKTYTISKNREIVERKL